MTLLNAHAKMYKCTLRVEIDKWGVLKACTDQALIDSVGAEIKYDQDWSKVEYELVENTKEVPTRGGRGRGRGRGQ